MSPTGSPVGLVAFVLDMARTVVTRGKVDVDNRLEKELPLG